VELRVASWNVDGWHTIRDEQLRLLDASGADLALLEEVTPTSLDRLREAGWHGRSALELVPDGHTERGGATPRFACAVLARTHVKVVSSGLIAGAASPVRATAALLHVDGSTLTAISAALPPGSIWGRHAKFAQADAIARTVEETGTPVIIGMDRNGPKFERWQSATTEWWPEDPVHFFDDGASHGCRDVLDHWFASHPDALRDARHERPDGPREVSYVEHRADPPVPRRYDLIMASSALEVLDVRHRYRDAIEAGSDHGLVEATVRL
jgi:endonuclease/exonuclease/phosphatase family metal-dependent hydrolase